MAYIKHIQTKGTNNEAISYDIFDEKAIHYYDNVSSMKYDTLIENGMLVQTKGYYTPGDGGDGLYYITNETLTSDNGFIQSVSNNLFAVLIIHDSVNIKQLGARSYDGTKRDIASYLAKYFNYLSNHPRIKLKIPSRNMAYK